MKVEEILRGLRDEQALLSVAIAKLEAVMAQRLPGSVVPRRRGRPPGSKNKPRVSDSGQK
jgi:hypothetical protein